MTDAWPMPARAPDFETAMSSLTYACGLLERHPPEAREQLHRMVNQIGRLETLEMRLHRALKNQQEA